jgi:hypothetical protein
MSESAFYEVKASGGTGRINERLAAAVAWCLRRPAVRQAEREARRSARRSAVRSVRQVRREHGREARQEAACADLGRTAVPSWPSA